jgi:PEP-CTERM motif
MFSFKNLALAVTLTCAAHATAANASVVYDLTLTPTSGGAIEGAGTMTINAVPSTGLNQVSNYFQTPQGGSGTLLDLSLIIGGDSFTLAQKNSGSNPLAQFTSGALDDITYAGTAANGDSLMMTSDFVFFMVQSRQQEIGTFSAVLDPPYVVPEPASLALMSGGLLTLAAIRRRRGALKGAQ